MKAFFLQVVAFLASLGAKLDEGIFRVMVKTGAVMTLGPAPTAGDFSSARVTNPGMSEAVRQRLYDYQVYAAGGVQQMNFFQQPVGQGVTSSVGAVVGTPKTYGDTNMQLGGQLPSGAQYLAQTVEVQFFPGSSAAANNFTPQTITAFNAAAAAAVTASVDDVNKFYQSGWLEFNILQKNYVREAPLITFPPQTTLSFSGALALTPSTQTAAGAAAINEAALAFARADGATYEIPGGLLLQPGMNFVVSLNWPAAVGTVSTFNGRVGVIVDGWLQRASQ